MPPKPKFTKDEIVAAALGVVSKNGIDALTAQALGNALGSSARPIFTIFNSMKEVQDEVRIAAMKKFESFTPEHLQQMPLFKHIGMKMVLFGVQEPKLYQLLFMQENDDALTFDDIYGKLGATADLCIEAICHDYSLSTKDAKVLFENVWIYTFGIGALCATKACQFSVEELGQMLSIQFQAMINFIKVKE